MARRIEIFDTTLRDGNKLPFVVLSPADRLLLARQLAALKVDVIEAGFPAASAEEADCVTRICSEVRGPFVAALARALPGDVQKALQCLRSAEKPYLHVYMSVAPQFLRQVLRMNEDGGPGEPGGLHPDRPGGRGAHAVLPERGAARARGSSCSRRSPSPAGRARR